MQNILNAWTYLLFYMLLRYNGLLKSLCILMYQNLLQRFSRFQCFFLYLMSYFCVNSATYCTICAINTKVNHTFFVTKGQWFSIGLLILGRDIFLSLRQTHKFSLTKQKIIPQSLLFTLHHITPGFFSFLPAF